MKNKLLSFLKQWGIPLIIGIIISLSFNHIAIFFSRLFTNQYFQTFTQNCLHNDSLLHFDKDSIMTQLSPTVTGSIGDTYGGTLGPIIAMVAAFLTFIAFWIQYRANKIQENYIKRQRFEDTFFRLLDHYKRNVDSMDIRDAKDLTRIKSVGCECFRSMYNGLSKIPKGNTELDIINSKYDKIQDRFKHDLHHYYRFLYHILKFIKESDLSDSERLQYSSILRASLSAYELIFIFYNCLHANGKKLKCLIEYFSFLKNLDESLIINVAQKNEFHDLAFASSTEREHLLKAWSDKNDQQ